MITRIKNLISLGAILCAPVLSALAQAPSGSVTFNFDRSTIPVWDFSGTYQFDQQIRTGDQARVGLSYSITITQNVRGILSSSGTILVGIGNDVVAAAYVATGRITGGGN